MDSSNDNGKSEYPDLTKCPWCGGPADNGFDRCLPPNPYLCQKCSKSDRAKRNFEANMIYLGQDPYNYDTDPVNRPETIR